MAKNRSPNYPSMDLAEALEAARPVYKAEGRNKFSRHVLAEHFGYSGLNGRALTKIGAVRAYGLVEGSSDDLRLSEDAIDALMAPDGSPERRDALSRLALRPPLFQELREQFQGLPSESNLKFWLIKQNFTPEAAGKAAETYLSTMRLVGGSDGDYNLTALIEEKAQPMQTGELTRSNTSLPLRQGAVLQEVFNLEEGPVTLSFPAALSADSYEDLEAYLQLFLKKAKRRASPRDGGHEDH